MQTAPATRSWHARLALQLENRGPRTVISARQHQGPLVIQKPFYPEGNPCHVYLLHPPAGLVGGDQLSLDIKIAPTAHTLITTPGATRFYRSTGPSAGQTQHLNVAPQGILEWLPQETILFNQCNATLLTQVDLHSDSRFIGWEILCLGRKAGGEMFNHGTLRQKLHINIDKKPQLIERTLLEGGSPLLSSPWGLANHTTIGTMVIAPANKDLLLKIRETMKPTPQTRQEALFSASLIDNLLVCRYLGPQAQDAKHQFLRAWRIARPHLLGIDACEPRIWNT